VVPAIFDFMGELIHKIDRTLARVLPGELYRTFIRFYRNLKGLNVFRLYRDWVFQSRLRRTQSNHRKLKAALKGADKVKVAFMVINASVWKYDTLYRMMEDDPVFEPAIVICPSVVFGKEMMKMEIERATEWFENKGYRMINTWDKAHNQWVDIKKSFGPDIVFFTNPHNQSHPQYFITNFLDTLTCYVPYGIMTPNRQRDQFDKDFHNFLWRAFYETPLHLEMAQKYSRNKGCNGVAVGYPVFDEMLEKQAKKNPPQVWKSTVRPLKKIIWAPHHTLNLFRERQNYSSFLEYADFMIEIAEKYKDQVQFAFKPHPGLRPKLSQPDVWGEAKTTAYYEQWDALPNAQTEEEGYINLFLQSDGLILDSISFMVEYMFTGKPLIFTIKDDTIEEKFNEFGQIAFQHLYKGYNKQDVVNFIEEKVISSHDPMEPQRTAFFNHHFPKRSDGGVSGHILQQIKNVINIQNT
jgi:hypothetical protein